MSREEYWTVAEVAARLKVDPETVRRWIRSGELKAVPLGHRTGYRITESDLDAFIQSRKLAA